MAVYPTGKNTSIRLDSQKHFRIFASVNTRLCALILSICLFSQIGGIWMVYTAAIVIHKQNKELRISDSSKWITRVLSHEQFYAFREGQDELMIDGVMFDIVSVAEHGSIVTAVMVEDGAENKLKNTLTGIQRSNHGWSETAKMAASFGLSPYLPANTTQLDSNYSEDTILDHDSFYIAAVSHTHDRSLEQPPSCKM
jgi:hypothetical protein